MTIRWAEAYKPRIEAKTINKKTLIYFIIIQR